ncbi:MAG: hypothetical protein K8I27_00005 [Planctomycetes bacterium]|nr:hypothetical protein [Planctomycetota bacterium]
MEVALRIFRKPEPGHAKCAAWFFAGGDSAAVLEALAQTGPEPLPRVYRTGGGCLIRPDTPQTMLLAGGLRMAEIFDGVFVPIDAELSPALLPDEARGLRPMLCLPDGFYALDLSTPMNLSELLAPGPVHRRDWKPLPKAPPQPNEIREFILDRPDDVPEELLDKGGDGIGEQEPAPDASGTGKSMLGKAEFAAGKVLAKLGGMFGSKGMQQAGGNLIGKGLNHNPKMTEGLMGKQEAALRDLLRKFKEGRVDEALRRALPLGAEASRGARPSGSALLPFHNLMYSLGGLIGRGSGGAGMWFTEPDIYGALVGEYRKAADDARKSGDHRRAAYIYGKLLGDYRTAALTLQQGGLHHDAAVLYLKKLNDPVSAARAWETAGNVDEAVRLYRKIGQHVPAGDLLRRAGDDEGALEEYRAAARLLAARGEYAGAGELMMAKTGAGAEALTFLSEGWRARPHPGALPCALHMAVIHADDANVDELLKLTDESDRFFAPPGQEAQAARYYNMLATLARRESMGEHRAELRDRALCGIANNLRRRQNNRTIPFDSKAWSDALVSDAQFAVRHEARRRPKQATSADTDVVSTVRIATGVVVAAVFADDTGELFVAFQDGRIYRFSPTGGTGLVREGGRPVVGLAVSPKADMLVVSADTDEGDRELSCFARRADGQFFRGRGTERLRGDVRLLSAGDNMIALLEDWRNTVVIRRGEGFEPYAEYPLSAPGAWHGALIRNGGVTGLLLQGDRRAYWLGTISPAHTETKWQEAATHWRAMGFLPGAEGSLIAPSPGNIELAGRNEHGSLYWSALKAGTFGLRCESRIVAARGDYLCATLLRPGRVAGVTGTHVNWFKKEGEGFEQTSITRLGAPDAVACFHNHGSSELMVLTRDGRVCLVATP